MNQVLIATLVALSILGSGAYAASLVADTSATSTVSSEIDNDKKSESIRAVYDGTNNIIVENTGRENSKVVMFRFYDDETGNEINRVMIDDETGRDFGATSPVLSSNKIDFENGTLKKRNPISFSLSQLDLLSMDGVSGEIVTKYGNIIGIQKISALQNGTTSNGNGNGTDNGQAMINGMGILSRIVQAEYDSSSITHGIGMIGKYESLKPYTAISNNTDFAATILDTDTELTYVIPEFWKQYNYTGDSLTDTTPNNPNLLGYLQTRNVVGTVTVSNVVDGITASGTGKAIIKLNDYTDQELILRGNSSLGVAKIITSPWDLMTETYTGNGFLTKTFSGDPGTNSFSVLAGKDSTHTGIFDYDQRYNWMHQHPCKCSIHPHIGVLHHISVSSSLVETDNGDYLLITGDSTNPVNYPTYTPHQGNTSPTGTINHSFKLYDTLPSKTKRDLTGGTFETKFEFLEHPTYMYVEPNGTSITIKGEASVDIPFLKISNVTANIPYQIKQNNAAIITGMTSTTGQILIDNVNGTSLAVGGILHLYPDSLAYRGSFDAMVFDNLNDETIPINTIEDKTYVVHAYAKIPVVGNITVTGVNLDAALDLPYLNKQYVGGDMHVPVIPGYDTINLTINEMPASINYADILGGVGIKISEPSTSTITSNSPDVPFSSAEATTGTVAYAIAQSDGTIKAIMTETISGTVSITNKYILELVPPIPRPMMKQDPLSGWVDIFVNGVLIKQTTLGINPNPVFEQINTISGNVVTRSVTYTYADYTLSGNVSVDVNAGDFVEFFMYSKIHGDIESYTAPDGHRIVSSSGVSSATANIRSAHVQTSM